MTVQLVIFRITITTTAVTKIKQTALIIVITEQVSKVTAIATQVEEVAALTAVEVLQVAHVLQEFHKP
jgi:hypothetical protein